MNRIISCFFSCLLALSFIGITSYLNAVDYHCNTMPYQTFASWQKAVNAFPTGIKAGAITLMGARYTGLTTIPGLTEPVFNNALDTFSIHMQTGSFNNPRAWLDHKAPTTDIYNLNQTTQRPIFVQQKTFSVGDKIIPIGDRHGDVHGLLTTIADYIDPDSWRIKDPRVHFLFLGDYTDRGIYGYESIFTLLSLKNANPHQVFLIRGNHEDKNICSHYGFTEELASKGISPKTINKIFNFFELLPSALYFGSSTDYMQGCHGGIELSYNPQHLRNAPELVEFQRLPELTSINGFMWADYCVNPQAHNRSSTRPRYNKQTVDEYLAKVNTGQPKKLRGFIRAHQHGDKDMMNRILGKDGNNNDNHGVAKLWTTKSSTGNLLWHGIVVTFNVAPDTLIGLANNFDYDTHGIITVAEKFEDWTLEVRRVTVITT